MSAPIDPRNSITTESFGIAPELLGIPLATPWRRAVAMIADLIPVAVLANAGLFVFLAFAGAFLVWRSASFSRPRAATPAGRRPIARLAAGLAAFIIILNIGNVFDRGEPRPRSASSSSGPDPIAEIVQDALAAAGLDGTGSVAGADAAADSALIGFAAALAAGDTGTARSLRPAAEAVIAGPRLERAERVIRELGRDNAELERENARLRDSAGTRDRGGLLRRLASFADDLGIGFGWGALYFTAFLVLMRGQTPGKRLLGIRVIRLDGRPIGWWYAFERFGSYFASFSTGLLGFAQIFWDRNRQALHDKAVETVVIRSGRGDHATVAKLNAARR